MSYITVCHINAWVTYTKRACDAGVASLWVTDHGQVFITVLWLRFSDFVPFSNLDSCTDLLINWSLDCLTVCQGVFMRCDHQTERDSKRKQGVRKHLFALFQGFPGARPLNLSPVWGYPGSPHTHTPNHTGKHIHKCANAYPQVRMYTQEHLAHSKMNVQHVRPFSSQWRWCKWKHAGIPDPRSPFWSNL